MDGGLWTSGQDRQPQARGRAEREGGGREVKEVNKEKKQGVLFGNAEVGVVKNK